MEFTQPMTSTTPGSSTHAPSPTCAIVISSVDHFSDIWPQFFHFFFHYWPEPPFKIYLITNFKYFDDSRVQSIQLGRDQHWGTNLLQALDHIDCDYVLYMQDDYLINSRVSNDVMQRAVQWMHAAQADYLNLLYSGKTTHAISDAPYEQLDLSNQWIVDLQAAIWKKNALQHVVQRGWTPWDAESKLNDYSKSKSAHGFYSVNAAQRDYFRYLQAVKGGFWLKDAVDFCRQHHVPVNLRHRPCPPWGNAFFKKLYRSCLKRKMKAVRQFHAIVPGPAGVKPLSVEHSR